MTWLARCPGWLLCACIAFAPALHAQSTFRDCAQCPLLVTIPGGVFTMGSPTSERERRQYEGPRQDVRVASFALGRSEVTKEQYAAFVADTQRSSAGGCFTYGFSSFTDDSAIDLQASWRAPGFEQRAKHPVVCVSWEDARDYAAWFTRFFWGENEARTCAYANGGDASLLRALPALRIEIIRALQEGDAGARFVQCDDRAAFTRPVRRYRPNAFGLYDMIGNAWEFVADCWHEELPRSGAAYTTDGCKYRRARGGSWDDFPEELRSARRTRLEPHQRRNDSGFRIARDLVSPSERSNGAGNE